MPWWTPAAGKLTSYKDGGKVVQINLELAQAFTQVWTSTEEGSGRELPFGFGIMLGWQQRMHERQASNRQVGKQREEVLAWASINVNLN